MQYRILTDLYPLLIQVNPAESTVANLQHLFKEVDAIYARNEPVAWLSVFRRGAKLEGGEPGRVYGEWAAAMRPTMLRLNVGTAFYSESRVFGMFLSAILLAQPMPVAYRASTSIDNLAAWLQPLMAARGLSLPADAALRIKALLGAGASQSLTLAPDHSG